MNSAGAVLGWAAVVGVPLLAWLLIPRLNNWLGQPFDSELPPLSDLSSRYTYLMRRLGILTATLGLFFAWLVALFAVLSVLVPGLH